MSVDFSRRRWLTIGEELLQKGHQTGRVTKSVLTVDIVCADNWAIHHEIVLHPQIVTSENNRRNE
jgi:hypothetical protein